MRSADEGARVYGRYSIVEQHIVRRSNFSRNNRRNVCVDCAKSRITRFIQFFPSPSSPSSFFVFFFLFCPFVCSFVFFLFVLFCCAAFRILWVTATDDDSPHLLLTFFSSSFYLFTLKRNSSGRADLCCKHSLAHSYTDRETERHSHHKYEKLQTNHMEITTVTIVIGSRKVCAAHTLTHRHTVFCRAMLFSSSNIRTMWLLTHRLFAIAACTAAAACWRKDCTPIVCLSVCEWQNRTKQRNYNACIQWKFNAGSRMIGVKLSSRDHFMIAQMPTTANLLLKKNSKNKSSDPLSNNAIAGWIFEILWNREFGRIIIAS